MNIKNIITAGILLFSFSLNGQELNYERPFGYVLDKANIFSKNESQQLEEMLKDYYSKTGISARVLTVTEVFSNDRDLKYESDKIGKKWEIGIEGSDNGLLLTIAPDSMAYAVSIGRGIEPLLPDIMSDRFSRENFPPNFRKGDYYSGVKAYFDDVRDYLGEGSVEIMYQNQKAREALEKEQWDNFVDALLNFLIAIPVLGILFYIFVFFYKIHLKRKEKREKIKELFEYCEQKAEREIGKLSAETKEKIGQIPINRNIEYLKSVEADIRDDIELSYNISIVLNSSLVDDVEDSWSESVNLRETPFAVSFNEKIKEIYKKSFDKYTYSVEYAKGKGYVFLLNNPNIAKPIIKQYQTAKKEYEVNRRDAKSIINNLNVIHNALKTLKDSLPILSEFKPSYDSALESCMVIEQPVNFENFTEERLKEEIDNIYKWLSKIHGQTLEDGNRWTDSIYMLKNQVSSLFSTVMSSLAHIEEVAIEYNNPERYYFNFLDRVKKSDLTFQPDKIEIIEEARVLKDSGKVLEAKELLKKKLKEAEEIERQRILSIQLDRESRQRRIKKEKAEEKRLSNFSTSSVSETTVRRNSNWNNDSDSGSDYSGGDFGGGGNSGTW